MQLTLMWGALIMFFVILSVMCIYTVPPQADVSMIWLVLALFTFDYGLRFGSWQKCES